MSDGEISCDQTLCYVVISMLGALVAKLIIVLTAILYKHFKITAVVGKNLEESGTITKNIMDALKQLTPNLTTIER